MKYLWLCLALAVKRGQAASCTINAPLETSTGSDLGFIMIPGAQIPGQQYEPLVAEIQKQLPGVRLWTGVTSGWLGNFPNPIEIAGAVDDCLSKAQEQGLHTTNVYMAGHSLGGIMLETWIEDNPDRAAGIILLGSYLPDLFGSHENVFQVPVLTAVGELDGLTISFVFREWQESQEAEDLIGMPGRFPVHVIDDANHGQVASGAIPEFVTSQDIPSPISFEEAHSRYATSVAAFVTVQSQELFTDEEVSTAESTMENLHKYTSEFLVPFAAASAMENDGTDSSPWMIQGQKILLDATEEELANLEVVDFVVPFADLGDAKPQVNSTSACQAVVSTMCQPQYESNVADADILISAKVIKAKFKLEDVVRETLCLDEVPRRQCMDINIQAFQTALELATDEARERFEAIGTKLIFSDDNDPGWGPGWEYSSGLHYKKVNETHTDLHSTCLISPPDFFIPSAAGMHYCDLLSPFRALEWIYIVGLQGKSL